MKIGTIRREALRLMFASYGDMLENASYNELYDNPQYAPYLANMEMSINRAVGRMATLGALPLARCALTNPVVTGSVATFNLGSIEDLASVEDVMEQSMDAYTAHAYHWEGGTTLVVPLFSQEAIYILLYRRKIAAVDSLTPDEKELDVPEELAHLIPYYVKSELYEEDDAVAAKRARDYFEVGVAQYVADKHWATPVSAPKYVLEDL